MSSQLINILNDAKLQIAGAILAQPAAEHIPGTTPEERRATLLANLDSTIGLLQQGPDIQEQTIQELARAQLDASPDPEPELMLLETEREAIVTAIKHAYPEAAEALEALDAIDRLTACRTRALGYMSHLRTVDQLRVTLEDMYALRTALQELSAPIVPLYTGVLVLPLVGSIDSRRAQEITESLLEAIAREQADLVIIDITGIATIDTGVANHLLQTARAASLLGSQIILVGISSDVAQTLVTLDIDFGGLVTLSDLQSGIEYALDQLGLAILPNHEQLVADARSARS